jgi:monoamine oxidase
MARTARFAALRRLLRQAAPRPGAGAGTGPSRRAVLGGLLGAAAVVPLGSLAAGCGDNLRNPDQTIAIIGAGIAGLTCAHFLALAGVRAQLYEASGRVGGRMFTSRGQLAGGQLCELGGELIDSGHVTIAALSKQLGRTVDDLPAGTPGVRHDLAYVGGGPVDDAALVAAFVPIAAKMDQAIAASDASAVERARIDHLSIAQWLADEAQLPASSTLRRLLEVAYREEFGLEVDQQSAFNLLTLIDHAHPDPFHVFGASDERFHLHEGSDALPTAIAAALADQVVLDHALTRVVAGADGRFALTFATADGAREVVVDQVVYALPFTRLREVDLGGAGLSADKQRIIAELGYGTGAKLMLQFASRPWLAAGSDGSCITDLGALQATWDSARGQAGAFGVLTNFVGGDRGVAIGDGSAETQAATVLPWIEQIYPGAAAAYLPGSALRQHWPSAPQAKGSYACYRLGQWSFLGLEGRREGNQHFCGEHCSEDFQGYMEGGAETGAMVAAEVLEDLGVALPPQLVGLLAVKTDRPRGSYHGGRGATMALRDLRRG